ncbi:major facilitator superfamily domain-containing protein [Phialemonium atrogriseum]|uniref:Major facilitator superfamily domain-containing protein n=1 Tax=Phialemonium atrogriseum TaxID=1093897 RepID=A0AAJ0C739_9PEZI|nr:major facilitator superfamily domain-containing protein [Phialemonium atrogriseum]KAK1770208.1 major facilitator superfamily domain-containing protein [Phialemonium atrogriseum]
MAQSHSESILVDEKHINAAIESQGSGSDVGSIEPDWTEEEEKALVRKIDFLVMPLLMLSFFALQMDRGNIGNALTDFFFADVGITQNQFNIGQQLLSLGIVLLEIPSNLVLYRVGPSLWIGCQIVAWGLIATFQAFQKGLGPFLATRLLLGLAEAGFIPACLYTITRWYKRDETSTRFSWVFIGNLSAGATTGLIAYGILQMRGIAGLGGWQWLFLIEGMFTVVVGIIFLLLFPQSTSKPVSLVGIRLFSERESYILTSRVLADDPQKEHAKSYVTPAELKHTLTNWRLIPHVIATICGLAPISTMMSYAPTLVHSFGYERLKSNAMASIGAFILIIITVAWGHIGDKLRLRGPLVALGLFIYWGFVLGDRLLVESHNPTKRFALLTLTICFGSNWHPIHGSWLALNARTAGERSITMAIFIMAANTSGIVGSQLFQQEDAPLYRTGWTIITVLVSVSLLASLVSNIQYRLLNRRQGNKAPYHL